MKKSDKRIGVWAACLLFAGCAQTTTTTMSGPKPDADEGDAADLNYELGARYYRQGSYELARDRLEHSISLNPKNAVAHYTLALAYEALGNLRLATESYEASVRMAPRNYQVQNAYAVFLCKQQDFDGARKHFDKAANSPINDDAQVTLTNAGVCMIQKPDAEAAEDYFRRALERKSNYGEALLQMALLKQTNGQHMNARAFLQRYLSSNPATSSVLYLGVMIEDKLGDQRARREYSDRILREFPQSNEARRVREAG